MHEGEFEWNDEKAASNLARHGVPFEAAMLVFDDPFAVEFEDDRQDYNETRFVVIGMAENRLLYVAYTIRNESTRVISARIAEPFEKRLYHEQR